MKIEKLGYYRTRDSSIARVTKIDSDQGAQSRYVIGGEIEYLPGSGSFTQPMTEHRTWTARGFAFQSDETHSLNLVEYLDPQDYPELYI